MCSVSYNYSYPSLLAEEQSKKSSSAAMEVEAEASYSCGFLPAGRHPPYRPPPPHPAEDGELWEYFPCPFCYIEVEVPFICNHLQEEHCFDTKNAVCPICADNLGKDMSAHFRVQHSHLLKRRKPSKPNSWPAASRNKEPYEVNSSEGPYQMNTYMVNRSYQDLSPDPLLSQFICSIDEIESKSHSGVSHCENVISAIPEVQRSNQHVTQLELEERLQRIEFLKEIFMSTIL